MCVCACLLMVIPRRMGTVRVNANLKKNKHKICSLYNITKKCCLLKRKKMASVLILTFKQRAKGAKRKRNVLFLSVIKSRPVQEVIQALHGWESFYFYIYYSSKYGAV